MVTIHAAPWNRREACALTAWMCACVCALSARAHLCACAHVNACACLCSRARMLPVHSMARCESPPSLHFISRRAVNLLFHFIASRDVRECSHGLHQVVDDPLAGVLVPHLAHRALLYRLGRVDHPARQLQSRSARAQPEQETSCAPIVRSVRS